MWTRSIEGIYNWNRQRQHFTGMWMGKGMKRKGKLKTESALCDVLTRWYMLSHIINIMWKTNRVFIRICGDLSLFSSGTVPTGCCCCCCYYCCAWWCQKENDSIPTIWPLPFTYCIFIPWFPPANLYHYLQHNQIAESCIQIGKS